MLKAGPIQGLIDDLIDRGVSGAPQRGAWFHRMMPIGLGSTIVVLAGLALAGPIRSCSPWVQADCSRPSRPGGTAVTVEFVNRSPGPVRILWVDYKGIE